MSQTTKPSAIVLDIEGTITPISFVTDTLFPYARDHLEEHLQGTFDSDETQADIALLQDEVSAQRLLQTPQTIQPPLKACLKKCTMQGFYSNLLSR